ncbi:aminotransferase class V-fold PLP-dependent enzyme [Candidatus Ulvibacter alkanivorans]|uniref:aminotransferase class V-fold PLP-dependent enzyme n=1 Tax=Candidatus Ulvibacter alkanivorans TaxID=2267620 RepID=UPI000DF19D70|nr:aminotransferase class V-fold PLP-dependent enzyme [Candidatus Ulvibacter alkanivorans]
MLSHQKDLFALAENVTYLNGAYMSPQLRSVEKIGIENLKRKSEPYTISESDFFSEKIILKQRFAKLIECNDPESIAIIPSVSYGIATALHNIPFNKGDEIIVLEEQFPSNYYAWKQLEKQKGVRIKTIVAPPIVSGRGKQWNIQLLEAITTKTKCVAIPHVHWADGTKFDLVSVRKRTLDVGAFLIVDGTQSVGAMPFSIKEIQPDALVCGGYKWLLGPYSLGVAYFGERFHHGNPIENNWMNHQGSEDFSNLVTYNETFKPKATRYDVGESSNFILTPMLSEAIRQLLEWTPAAIQKYCEQINTKAVQMLQEKGYFIEAPNARAHHLFGIYLPKEQRMAALKSKLSEENILVSYRGEAIRVSPNVYNSQRDLEKLYSCF